MMTFEEFHAQMNSFRERADRDAEELKDSYVTLDRLHELYSDFERKGTIVG
jgi:hypothetical protein